MRLSRHLIEFFVYVFKLSQPRTEAEQNPSVPQFVMSFHEVIVFTITIAGVFIQVEFQSKGSSLLDTHYWIMSIFFVAFLVFVAEWLMRSRTTPVPPADGDNVNHAGALSEISLVSGMLAIALLFLIIHVVIGCAILVFLAIYVIKRIYSYKPVNDRLFLYLDKLKIAKNGNLDEEINE
ncbi:hypothetical protein TIFTF001_046349 [Ficus carica]|uniref:Uncharacterized protein n=1 Tax=Ficus carica TaxID=3494 RepID=A0AA88CPD8_FICCA|nr:hypothetical protein TIFTF001_046346 [Ficus carica]GMN29496.1 hypothetical protein TIFTF001_046347 [Ficus carica]GMN29512.1 hypothetical protein TIFTF001_046348 [Ficus carica]GMN29519.1 hypothetical protein TIFTF001_046349 [Ficus carica]